MSGYNSVDMVDSIEGQAVRRIGDLETELAIANDELRIMRKCVEFYADEDNWDLVCMRADGEGSAAPIFTQDHGAARQCLKEIDAR